VVSGGRSAYGFEITSELAFRFLRSGTSRDRITVDTAPSDSMAQSDQPIYEWKFKDAAGDVSGRLHCRGSLYHVWFADAGWFRVDPVARRITAPADCDPVTRELRTLGVPTTLCSVARGDASLHAAAVEIDGEAVLFAAPGQHGKTTLALAFHSLGYRVLSEDVSCCRFDATPVLCPGPALLRVRPDVYGASPSGTSVAATRPDRVILHVDDARAGTADGVPVRAILLLRQSDEEIRLERVDKVRSLPDLYALSFRVGGSESAADTFARVGRLAATTPIWNLHRPFRRDTLEHVVALIAGSALGAIPR
jgi:hypothetical protein